jgi:hypothetical protein
MLKGAAHRNNQHGKIPSFCFKYLHTLHLFHLVRSTSIFVENQSNFMLNGAAHRNNQHGKIPSFCFKYLHTLHLFHMVRSTSIFVGKSIQFHVKRCSAP